MNARELFLKIMNYEPVDRVPVMALEPFGRYTIERWQSEGLPKGVSVQQYLKMDQIDYVPVTFRPMPGFDESTIISEDDQYIIQLDDMGTTVRRRKDSPDMYVGHIDHPVKSREDWYRYRERFLFRPERIKVELDERTIKRFNESENPVGICLYPFFFRLGFYAMGMERFMTAFYDDADLVHDMFAHWADLVCQVIHPVLSAVKIDVVTFNEDLAYRTAPHVAPNVYEQFWCPHQDKVVSLLQRHNVPVICMWTAGNVDPYIPILLKHGFNCTWPLEGYQNPKMDAARLRQRYGRDLRLAGNISKQALIEGPDAIDREIERLMPMIHEGGFFPALDDMVPVEVPFANYRYLIDRIRSIRL